MLTSASCLTSLTWVQPLKSEDEWLIRHGEVIDVEEVLLALAAAAQGMGDPFGHAGTHRARAQENEWK